MLNVEGLLENFGQFDRGWNRQGDIGRGGGLVVNGRQGNGWVIQRRVFVIVEKCVNLLWIRGFKRSLASGPGRLGSRWVVKVEAERQEERGLPNGLWTRPGTSDSSMPPDGTNEHPA